MNYVLVQVHKKTRLAIKKWAVNKDLYVPQYVDSVVKDYPGIKDKRKSVVIPNLRTGISAVQISRDKRDELTRLSKVYDIPKYELLYIMCLLFEGV